MWRVGERFLSMMVLCAVSIHFSWAVILLFDPSGVNSTAVHALYQWLGTADRTALVSGVVAILALIGIFSENNKLCVFLLAPQQIVLTFSAAGAIEAIYLQQFADGVLRPFGFIATDLIDVVWVAIWHTCAIVAHALRLGRNGS